MELFVLSVCFCISVLPLPVFSTGLLGDQGSYKDTQQRQQHVFKCSYLAVPQADVHADSLTHRTEASTSQQSLPSPPVLPDIPVVAGVEESETAGDQDDKEEELEFPHDLLPSLDFSSELNIWESSLG